jgi:hypothetical protein
MSLFVVSYSRIYSMIQQQSVQTARQKMEK